MDAEAREHLLRMVARNIRLRDGRRRIRIESRKQDRGLDLCTCNGAFVVNAAQLCLRRYNREREIVVPAASIDLRSHLRERSEHTPHRAARQRGITAKHGEEWLRSEQAHHEAQRRPRVPRIKDGQWFGQPV